MALCASCGLALIGDNELCSHHHISDDFAVNNRVMCDGLHRDKWPKRLPAEERDEMIDYSAMGGCG